jgi:predicted DNA-binding protein
MARARTIYPLRMQPEERAALKTLSKIEGRPINQLLNEAIRIYLQRRGKKERSLEATLARLREYRKKDPAFRKADAAFAEAEATLDDPLEGQVVKEASEDKSRAVGPIQRKVREVLGA